MFKGESVNGRRTGVPLTDTPRGAANGNDVPFADTPHTTNTVGDAHPRRLVVPVGGEGLNHLATPDGCVEH